MERSLFSFVLDDPYELAAQFVTWEWAVALLGVLLGVNPFGQPDVAAAKAATEQVLEGRLHVPEAQIRVEEGSVTFGGALEPPARQPTSLAEALSSAIGALCPGDYLALLAFLPDDPGLWESLSGATAALAVATGHAVTLELGPRYLHSTGQLHKGGRDNGVFVMLTAGPTRDSDVPGRDWTLAQLHRAQADGDFATLSERGRRVLRVDLPGGSTESVDGFAKALLEIAFRS
jgi:glucose-6-phosphate isomerase